MRCQNHQKLLKAIANNPNHTSKGSNAKFRGCEFNINPGFSSAACDDQQHVSSTLNDIGQECIPVTYRHRIIYMEMMNELEVTDMPCKNDDLRIQHAQDERRPGHTTNGRPINAISNRKALQILHTFQERRHPVVLDTTVFEQVTLKQKEKRQHLFDPETISVICKLIGPANLLCCILLAIMKCMDYLLEKILIEAKERNFAQVKFTPREHDRTNAAGNSPCSVKLVLNTEWKI